MKKNLILAAIALLMAMSLFAGGSSESASDDGIQTITLNISHNMDFTTIPNAFVDAAERLNARYEAEGKNIRVEFEKDYQTIDWTEYQNAIVFSHKIKEAPDIYAISDVASLIKAGCLLDITDVVEKNADKFGSWEKVRAS